MKNFKKKLVQNLTNYFKNSGFKTAIIGISGGIDSAVTLAIAVEALGKENVRGYLLPYRLGEISSHTNFEDAQEISEFFGIEYEEIEIDEFAQPYTKLFPEISGKTNLAFANSLARIRMTVLFGFANKLSGLVLGTCNKSEIMLGYETKFGDGACDVNVLGNLWKSEVYALARVYNIPEKFITKNPSAELFENHSDEEEMGFSYAESQKILEEIHEIEISENKTQKFLEIQPRNTLEKKIFKMYEQSAHKRIFPPTLAGEVLKK